MSQTRTIPVEDGHVVYSETIETPYTSASELQERAIYFFKTELGLSLDLNSKDMLGGKGEDAFYAGRKNNTSSTKLKIQMDYLLVLKLQDGKYTIEMSKINYTPYPTPENPQPLSIKADDLYKDYRANRAKKKRRANKQYEFFLRTEKVFAERREAIREVMKKSVPQLLDDQE